MAFPFKRILCPIDFDDNAASAVALAANIARQNGGVVFLFHVVPLIAPMGDVPVYVEPIYKREEELSRQRLGEIARAHLADLKHEIHTHIGDTEPAILHAEKRHAADLIVMATHGRRGLSRVFLGSTAEIILRESSCPVLIVHGARAGWNTVAHWMTPDPPVASPEESLAAIRDRMRETAAAMLPVIEGGRVVGAITSRDLLDVSRGGDVKLGLVMDREPATITPGASTGEAARMMRERKLEAIAVVDDGQLAGVVTASGLLGALTARD